MMNTIYDADGIAKQLAADIHSQVLTAGEAFPSERELCERFLVGRNTVRSSITILKGMGLTEQVKGGRPRVVTPSLTRAMESVGASAHLFFKGPEGKAHLEQARLFLETSILRYAVEHATSAQIAKLIETVERCNECLTNVEKFRESDVKFHRTLAEIPGNPVFVALHEAFVERLMKSRPVPDQLSEASRHSVEDHRLIVVAILDRDAVQAEKVLTEHLQRNFGNYFRQSLAR